MASTDDGRFYPSVVVEVGFSQTEESLREKIAAWLKAGNDRTGVRCVIKINIEERERPPAWIKKFRVHRRGQARVPSSRTITADQYATNPNNPRYAVVLTAQEVCYPAEVPAGFQDVTLDFGRVYECLPGIYTTDEAESEEEGEDEEEREAKGEAGDGDATPGEGVESSALLDVSVPSVSALHKNQCEPL